MSPDDDYGQFYADFQDEMNPDPKAKQDLTNCGRVKCRTCEGYGTIEQPTAYGSKTWFSCPDCIDGYVKAEKYKTQKDNDQ